MHLLLLRHGDALQQGFDDTSRPLSPLGEKQASVAAGTLQRFNISIDIVVSSPLERARQTAKIVQYKLNVVESETSEYLIPDTDQCQLIQYLSRLQKPTVLLVGHEPHLSRFISNLITGTSSALISMKKGSLACLDVPSPLERGTGSLLWLLGYEEMRSFIQPS